MNAVVQVVEGENLKLGSSCDIGTKSRFIMILVFKDNTL